MRVLGIDEAGRGAVIGPLVIAGVCGEENITKVLKEIGVKDSKKLSPRKREEIFRQCKALGIRSYGIHIPPKKIDGESINELEIKGVIRIIKKFCPQKVFLDVPAFGKGIERYCEKIRREVGEEIEVVGGNKFDFSHAVVAAASIAAKVMRDRAIEWLKKKYGDFGSGYPNERTIAYIRHHFDSVKPIVRMKWKTIRKIKNQKPKTKTTNQK